MNMKSILTLTLCTLFLMACNKENPLEQHSPENLGVYLFEKSSPAISKCARVWEFSNAANPTTITECEPVASYVAQLLTDGGFGEISSQNIKFPEMWSVYNRLLQEEKTEIQIKGSAEPFKW